MPLEDLLTLAGKLPGWIITPQGRLRRTARNRAGVVFLECPITAVCNDRYKTQYHEDDFYDAGLRLDLPAHEIETIIGLADESYELIASYFPEIKVIQEPS